MPKRKSSLKERRKKRRNVFVALGAIALIILLVLLWFALRRPEVTVVSIDISGTHYIEENAVEDVVQETLDGSYAWLIPKRNAFFYPKQDIKETLQETFLPINILSIDRDRLTGLLVSIEERQPLALWCGNASTSSCFLMDKTGLLFEPADEENPGMIVYKSEPLALGSVFLNGDFFEFHELTTTLHTIVGKSVGEVLVDENNDVFIYLRDGGEIRFVRSDDKQTLLDNITSTFSSKRFKEGQKFEYVDFRFGNKVYVRFIDE